MKTIITTASTTTGYALVIRQDDGQEQIFPITKTAREKKTGIDWLVLPENPTNRKLLNPARMKGINELELTYKESKTFGPRDPNATPKAPTKGWVEYLTDEEKAIYDQLKAKAENRAKIAQLKAQMAADQARLAELEAQA